LAPIIDARATTQLIDSYFLVVAWGRTKTKVVLKSLGTAKNMHDGVIGAVLNNANIASMGKYDGLSQAYYENPDYATYGMSQRGG
jgi:polysaccharide biosynthesis transport protein